MMTALVLYFSTLIVFLVIDAVMLMAVMKSLFDRHVGALMLEDPRLEIAAVFYLFYVGGIVWFASWPAMAPGGGGVAAAALNGAILGLLAYGTYEFVNMSTLKGWSWQMVAADTLWGMVLTALCAAAGVLIATAAGFERAGAS